MDSLEALLEAAHQNFRPIDDLLIKKAWRFAHQSHNGQTRLSGDPFVSHPIEVAMTIAKWKMDDISIVAGLLHDTVEDCGAKRRDLVREFGPEVMQLVEGVTKITDIRLTGSADERFAENLRKMILVMAKDLRVVLIKLADRLHNMTTLSYLPSDKQIENAKETLEIYAPLAERLGMGQVKGMLEDLAFPYVYPNEYKSFLTRTSRDYHDTQSAADHLKLILLPPMVSEIPGAALNIRSKHLYSLWKKLRRPEIGWDITKVHDLVAARVLVDTTERCYMALGIVHAKFRPVPQLGVSDYIANPKPNGYRSIHTKVFGPGGNIIEIQIRTREMHEEAEMGLSAHWYYTQQKSQEGKGFFVPADKLSWVRSLLQWQNEISDNDEYLRVLKFDALGHRNLVFSPKGDVYDLPVGATPVDFAYAVHSGMGHQTNDAKVNGRRVPLDHKLRNGDLVEIELDRKRTTPNRKWLEFVVTTSARHGIQRSIRLER
jgi:GTP diphosphokinase / guanosine-3',5'-bis(diphosphate) 3'-diphosphatase